MATQLLSDFAGDMSADGEGMTDDELASLLGQFASQAVGEEYGEIAAQQEQAINYYYRRMPDLPAQAGTSSVVADTVQVTVDDAMAEVLKPFVSAEEFASFSPVGPEDEEQAEQATEYVNYVLHCDNPGFIIFHNWFKDAFLNKIGITKTYWRDKPGTKQALVDDMGLLEARQHEQYQGEEDNGDGTYTVTLNDPDGRVVIDVIPPEEFKISPFARSVEEAPYSAHAPTNTTRSDLVEMGYDPEIVYALPTWSGTGGEEGRRNARYKDENYGGTEQQIGAPHPSQEVVGFREEYVRVDYNGDGIAELRKIHRVEDVILLNEETEDNPFALLCPKPMPHKVIGVSLADDAMDLQRIETVLWRQTLDNLYKSNNPRPVIPEGAERSDGSTIDSLADSAPGAAIYEGRSEIRFEAVPFVADKSFPMMQLVEQKRSARTGFQSLGNGLDPDAINKSKVMTATQSAQIEDKQNARAEMIARIFAETGVKRMMKLILSLLVKHQPKERMIRLRNEWVPVDPRGWNPNLDLTVNVGLGLGNKTENLAQAQALLEAMANAAETQFGSMITPDNAYKAFKRFVRAVGVKNVDDYVTGPEAQEPQEPQPDPAMEKVKGEQQIAAIKLQGEQQAQAAKLEFMQQEGAAKIQLAREQAAAEAQLAREKAAVELELAQQQQDMEMQLAERRMTMEESMAERKAKIAETQALSKNRPGGDLDK
jgi:hypothetical protein